MENPPTISIPLQDPFPAAPQSIDLAPLEFVLAIIAIIAIPALIYTFFFSIKCPSFFSSTSRQHNNPSSEAGEITRQAAIHKESHLTGECPVCLSAFAEDEQVRELSACKHAFHASCIDMWLNSHSNCPVCRASVALGNRPPSSSTTSSAMDSDHHQGLPDASSLV